MLLTALMPEMTVMFALAQWIQARQTAKWLQAAHGRLGFGFTQGFYVEMGGLCIEIQTKRWEKTVEPGSRAGRWGPLERFPVGIVQLRWLINNGYVATSTNDVSAF